MGAWLSISYYHRDSRYLPFVGAILVRPKQWVHFPKIVYGMQLVAMILAFIAASQTGNVLAQGILYSLAGVLAYTNAIYFGIYLSEGKIDFWGPLFCWRGNTSSSSRDTGARLIIKISRRRVLDKI